MAQEVYSSELSDEIEQRKKCEGWACGIALSKAVLEIPSSLETKQNMCVLDHGKESVGFIALSYLLIFFSCKCSV